MQRIGKPRTWAALFAMLGALALAAPAMASGFASARLGGLHANPVSIGPTSIYWNPGAIGKLEGNHLYLDGMFALRHATFEKYGPYTTQPEFNNGKGELSHNGFNLIVSPGVAFTTDFGGSNVVLGAGFYVPFGGQAAWGRTNTSSDPNLGFVNAGPQRWFTIDGKIQTLTGTLGAAVRTNDKTFSFGLMLNVNASSMDTIRARDPDGTDTVTSDGGAIVEGRSQLKVSSVDMSIGLGAHWNSKDQRFAAGASWQSGPNISGKMTMKGDLTNQFPPTKPQTVKVAVQQSLPQVIRFGLAYRFVKDPIEEGGDPVIKGELRLTGGIQTWNQFKNQCIVLQSKLDGSNDPDNPIPPSDIGSICKTNDHGVAKAGADGITQNLVRDWRVGYSMELSGSYYVNDRIELGAVLSYDSNSIPDYTLDPALMDMDKVVIGLGGNFRVTDWLAIMVQFQDVIYHTRDTMALAKGFTPMDSPNAQPSTAARYTQNIFITDLGLHFIF